MRIKKLLEAIKTQKIIDLKYILLEISLIFVGITLASMYNQYQNDLQDEKFLKETIMQIYEELKTDYEVNKKYNEGSLVRLNGINKLKKSIIERNISELESNEIKRIIANLPSTLSISNNKLGIQKLIAKDINLIKNKELKTDLLAYYDMMDYNIKDLEYFNECILRTKPFVFKHFINVDFYNLNVESIKNKNNLLNDHEFINTLNFIVLNLEIYKETNSIATIPRSKNLLKKIETEYSFQKN